jgi:hypothetical protein
MLQAVGNVAGVPATGMKETTARIDAAAVPTAAGTVGSDTPAGPAPVTGLTEPRSGARLGKLEARAAGAAAKVADMEAATEAAMVDTTAVATAAMTPQANAAEATTGEVAAAGGSAATPAEAATASTSHFPHQLNIRVHHHSFIFIFKRHSKYGCDFCARKKVSCCL